MTRLTHNTTQHTVYVRTHGVRAAGTLRQGADPAAAFMDAAFENEMNRLVAATKDKCVYII